MKARIEKSLSELIQVILDLITKQEATGLFSGSSGVALLLFYYAKSVNSVNIREAAINALAYSLENATESKLLTFCNGAAGIGWCLSHLQKNKLLDCDPNDLLSELDAVIIQSIEKDIKDGNYDYLHGAIGKCLYVLEREKFDIQLGSFSKKIYNLAIKDVPDQLKWESYSPAIGQNIYNLGLAHGLPNIILFYGKLYERNINQKFCKEIIIKCINFLLSSKLNPPKISLFPNWITKTNSKEASRLGWCYGDIGIGVCLFHVGQILKNEGYIQQSLEIFKHSTFRRSYETTKVIDAEFCHGAAGVAYIYYKMYLLTKDTIFKEAAEFWYNKTLDLTLHCEYTGSNVDLTKNYELSLGLLNGIAGIAFSLLQYQTGQSLPCDSCFLLS